MGVGVLVVVTFVCVRANAFAQEDAQVRRYDRLKTVSRSFDFSRSAG